MTQASGPPSTRLHFPPCSLQAEAPRGSALAGRLRSTLRAQVDARLRAVLGSRPPSFPPAVAAAPLFAAPALSAVPSWLSRATPLLGRPRSAAAPGPSLPVSALAAAQPARSRWPALEAAPRPPRPRSRRERSSAFGRRRGAARRGRRRPPRRKDLPGVRAAPDAKSIADGAKLFDGSGDFVTRSGAVYAPSRTSHPAVPAASPSSASRPPPPVPSRRSPTPRA